jgi:hypothetical protein
MIMYCRQCLFEGMALSDTPAHGTIHEGQALCLYHFSKQVEPLLEKRIMASLVMDSPESVRC